MKTRILDNLEHKNVKMRVFGSWLMGLSFIPAISHLFFLNTEKGIPFMGHYDLYNFVVGFGIQITWLLLIVGFWCGAYFISSLPSLFMILLNLIEIFTRELNLNPLLNFTFAIVGVILILLLRKVLIKAKFFENEIQTKLGYLEKDLEEMREAHLEEISESELTTLLNKNGIILKKNE